MNKRKEMVFGEMVNGERGRVPSNGHKEEDDDEEEMVNGERSSKRDEQSILNDKYRMRVLGSDGVIRNIMKSSSSDYHSSSSSTNNPLLYSLKRGVVYKYCHICKVRD